MKIKILIGIPASGKTTYRNSFLEKNPDWVAVSRDDFRYMLRNQGHCPDYERLISKLVDSSIRESVRSKKNVLYDATNCNIKYLREFVDTYQEIADIEFHILDVPVEVAIDRDSERDRKVGETVIRKMYSDYLNLFDANFDFSVRKKTVKHRHYTPPVYDQKLPFAVLCDLDGTLFHMNGKRSPYDTKGVENDVLDTTVASLLQLHQKNDHKVIFLSGRDEEAREGTVLALEKAGLVYDGLFMRKNLDMRKDSVIKRELYEGNILGKYNVVCVYDDRDQVVRLWRELGLKCLQVEYGDF